jgi:hypothetical protein
VSAVNAVTFYLSMSRSSSYYTRVQEGPTRLKLVLGDRQATSATVKAPTGYTLPVNVPWFIVFTFEPPVHVGPGIPWRLLDGDGDIYSAAGLKSSDLGNTGLPGTSRIFGSGCQYSRVENGWYSAKFDVVYTRSSQRF